MMSAAPSHVTCVDEIVRHEGASANCSWPEVVVSSEDVPSALAVNVPVTCRVPVSGVDGQPAPASDRRWGWSGRQMLDELGLESPALPVVVLQFAAEARTLVNPSNLQIADGFGVMRPISPGEVFDVAVVGAGPAGLAAAVGASSEGLQTLSLIHI